MIPSVFSETSDFKTTFGELALASSLLFCKISEILGVRFPVKSKVGFLVKIKHLTNLL